MRASTDTTTKEELLYKGVGEFFEAVKFRRMWV